MDDLAVPHFRKRSCDSNENDDKSFGNAEIGLSMATFMRNLLRNHESLAPYLLGEPMIVWGDWNSKCSGHGILKPEDPTMTCYGSSMPHILYRIVYVYLEMVHSQIFYPIKENGLTMSCHTKLVSVCAHVYNVGIVIITPPPQQ